MRLIDADALKKALEEDMKYGGVKTDEFDKGYDLGIKMAIEMLDNAPTIKAFTLLDIEKQYRKGLEKGLSEWETERPQGEWINTRPPEMSDNIVCSLCGYDSIASFNFCPNCGAKMKGGAE